MPSPVGPVGSSNDATKFFKIRQSPVGSPVGNQGRQAPKPAYAPCPTCGVMILTGHTPSGQVVTVQPDVRMYVVVWENDTAQPVLHESRGYPPHQCATTIPRHS
jgi:hypothetical protein